MDYVSQFFVMKQHGIPNSNFDSALRADLHNLKSKIQNLKSKTVPQVLTLTLLAALLSIFAYRTHQQRGSTPSAENSLEAGIWRMLDAARASDPDRYLDCYTGEMERLLRQNFQEMGSAKFREYLSGIQRQVKGIAVSAPQMSSPTEGRVSVEYVYENRNEVQQVYLRQVGKEWKIFRVEGAERIKTLVPYGTPVTE